MMNDLAYTVAKLYVEPVVVKGLTQEEAMCESRYILDILEMMSDMCSIY